MPHISERGKSIPSSPIRNLVPLSDAAKKRGINVYHLNIGQPDLNTPKEALEAIKNFDQKILPYSPSNGLESLRVRLSEYYQRFNIQADPSEIIITSGGSEAINFAFMTCLDPGDEIITIEPTYANYTAFAVTAGAVIKPVIAKIEDGFAMPDIKQMEEAITPKTKGILICNPNNPTGYLFSKKEMLAIRDLVKKHDLFLFSDEVYREFCYTDKPYISAFHLEGIEQNVVLIDSVSKRYSECGIRIGALVCKNKEVRDNVMKLCQARLSPPLLGQIAAEASINAPDIYMSNAYDEYISRRDLLVEGLNKIPGVFSPLPMGAFYAVASLPIDDASKFCSWLLSDFEENGATLMMAPASGFYTSNSIGKNQVRLAYVLKKEDLKKSLVLLKNALKVYPGRIEN